MHVLCRRLFFKTIDRCSFDSDSPLCSSNSLIPQALYVGLGRQVNLTCHMFIGNPANINFTWHLPNGAIHFGENYNSTSNFLSFKPKSNEDFGSIICRGENNIGLFDQCQIRIMLGGLKNSKFFSFRCLWKVRFCFSRSWSDTIVSLHICELNINCQLSCWFSSRRWRFLLLHVQTTR